MALDIDKIKIFLELYHHEYFSCYSDGGGKSCLFHVRQHHYYPYNIQQYEDYLIDFCRCLLRYINIFVYSQEKEKKS
ncbi:hypothetical protein DERP_006811 [Dermatophagoides pteronyssinus]|uniref:Uncharacterized protein n=1 Tax=Dermatophagoides pteronyssinus TaxID=6956 RepID=A0ABQ8IS31_DERPT|nr:hypothetical protein DERP_006811 [Dermatophagoides pteronyssinus]